MDTVVISIGGSVLIPDNDDFEYISDLAGMLKRISSELELFIVVGGGRVARYYIGLGRRFGVEEAKLDEIGISVTRLNARILISALSGYADDSVPETVDEAVRLGRENQIVVMGGTTPGHTTDGVAAELARALGAKRIINATAVDGVYSKDPKKHPDAKRFESLSFDELASMCTTPDWKAGPSNIFDSMGAEILVSERIPLSVLNGRDLNNLESAMKGEPFQGTRVGHGE